MWSNTRLTHSTATQPMRYDTQQPITCLASHRLLPLPLDTDRPTHRPAAPCLSVTCPGDVRRLHYTPHNSMDNEKKTPRREHTPYTRHRGGGGHLPPGIGMDAERTRGGEWGKKNARSYARVEGQRTNEHRPPHSIKPSKEERKARTTPVAWRGVANLSTQSNSVGRSVGVCALCNRGAWPE